MATDYAELVPSAAVRAFLLIFGATYRPRDPS